MAAVFNNSCDLVTSTIVANSDAELVTCLTSSLSVGFNKFLEGKSNHFGIFNIVYVVHTIKNRLTM